MLRDGTYKEAQYLQPDESLMPLYRKISETADRIQRKGYLLIRQNKTGEWVPAHHLADNYNLTHKKYKKNGGRVRHHVDFNKLNNDPSNVVRINWGEHWRIHYEHAKVQHENPLYRAKIAAGRNNYWSSSQNKAKHAEALSQRNKANWQDPAYREKMRQFLSRVNIRYIWEHPEKRKEFSQRLHMTLKRLWQTDEYRALMHEKIVRANKSRTTNQTGRLKFLTICKETLTRFSSLDQLRYEETRSKVYPYGAAPRWEKALNKYFHDDIESVLDTITQNHRVVKIEDFRETEDVYDLTIEGTHNFALASGIFVHNSIDGDGAAAMRYTEARMTEIAGAMLADIEKETVPFIDNYDATKKEPVVLPAAVPHLLLNGSLGIAVGMTTNIPPHHLGEVVDAVCHLIENPKTTTEDLLEYIKGPDFPTSGIIYNEKEIHEVYATGRGSILMRAVCEIVEKKNAAQIIITEIPYQVNKAEMIEAMAELVKEKRIEGIRDIRDASDRDGLRIEIDLKNDSYPQKVLNNLFKHTNLEKRFHVNMLALVDGIQPQVLSLKSILEEYLKHRVVVVTKRTEFELTRAKDRAHILEGLKKALDNIDAVINTIKKSSDRDDARVQLVKKFSLSEKQAVAILEMRLATLAGLERQKIEDELKEKLNLTRHLGSLLKDPAKIREVIKTELIEAKEKFAGERKTRVVKTGVKEFAEEDLIPEEESLVLLTRGGYIKRVKPETYRVQKRGGKGLIGMETKEEDVVEHLISANTHADLLFFTSSGKVFRTKVYEIPEGSRISKGKAIFNFLSLNQNELVTSVLAAPKGSRGKAGFLVMLTKDGVIKKVDANAFTEVRRSGLIALTLHSGDTLSWVKVTDGTSDIIAVTKKGQAVRFSEKDVRAMGRTAAGVRAMRLKKGDEVVGMDVIRDTGANLLIVTSQGYGKQTPLKQYKRQKRGGSGIKTAKVTPKNGEVISAHVTLPDESQLIAISRKGQVIRTELSAIPTLGRATQGVRIIRLDTGDALASFTTF